MQTEWFAPMLRCIIGIELIAKRCSDAKEHACKTVGAVYRR
jgi:hypothetical protein